MPATIPFMEIVSDKNPAIMLKVSLQVICDI